MRNYIKQILRFGNSKVEEAFEKSEKKEIVSIEETKINDLIDAKRVQFTNQEAKQLFKKYYKQNTFENLICEPESTAVISAIDKKMKKD